ncbi:MAG: efflux RND transporter periplasmic adaptor subunit [Gammaproteobacteria bacterium]|nr:efflux RND transporter periplasmic adaptor subunit [Gammaproteobacteria bacterium]
MTLRVKIAIGVLVVTVLVVAGVLTTLQSRNNGTQVRVEEVGRRDLEAIVTASGNIRARRTVDISSDVSGRIVELNVDEGDDVEEGQILLRIDQTQFQAAVAQSRAALSQREAQAAQQNASLIQATREYDRMQGLWTRDSTLVSRQQVDDAATQVEVSQALFTAAEHGVDQASATLTEAEDRLSKTTIRAPISGKVTRLNIELGETAIVGTMNNPGSLLLTVSDLSVIEAVMQVDETDVPDISVGDSAALELDAFPDTEFAGTVTEIGNSAIRPPSSAAGTGQTPTIDFEVVITLEDPPVELRPDLSTTADIVTEIRDQALAIPIIALTIRDRSGQEADANDSNGDGELGAGEAGDGATESSSARAEDEGDEEGVFVVRDGEAHFVPVSVGIAGEEYFEVLSGLSEGDTVVSGPYQRIRELNDGEEVRTDSASVEPDEPAS